MSLVIIFHRFPTPSPRVADPFSGGPRPPATEGYDPYSVPPGTPRPPPQEGQAATAAAVSADVQHMLPGSQQRFLDAPGTITPAMVRSIDNILTIAHSHSNYSSSPSFRNNPF